VPITAEGESDAEDSAGTEAVVIGDDAISGAGTVTPVTASEPPVAGGAAAGAGVLTGLIAVGAPVGLVPVPEGLVTGGATAGAVCVA
jgi:hypothetical protein